MNKPGGPITVSARGRTGITVQTVMRLVLSFSLLIAFTSSGAAALCLQMEQHNPSPMAHLAVGMDLLGQGSEANTPVMTVAPSHSPSAQTCCHQQVSTAERVTAPQRALPAEQGVALPVWLELLPADHRYMPPGFFDPALEKRDHLRPSLTALSISRT
ncbi:hypothetical protein [Arthrobacter sp. 260]|uniref:hypothetical protein n=1 Tax=Arthrobacter sp. 260 TaxID=2735314 RepID=UPI001490A5B2|nr:hypothetical protein [Arthrobacter sp. 260]NOJ60919.1 hypothetical protein [Arthrobacter sp. 260]